MTTLDCSIISPLDVPEQLYALMSSRYTSELAERFWRKVNLLNQCPCHDWDNRCYLWTASLSHGYGVFSVNAHRWDTHRFVMYLATGDLPLDRFVLHRPPCQFRACIRHLYLGTVRQNAMDAKTMGTLASGHKHGSRLHPESRPRGEAHYIHCHPESRQGMRNGNATTTDAEVLAIRADYASRMSVRQLQAKYRRSKSFIAHIVHNRSWRHLLAEGA